MNRLPARRSPVWWGALAVVALTVGLAGRGCGRGRARGFAVGAARCLEVRIAASPPVVLPRVASLRPSSVVDPEAPAAGPSSLELRRAELQRLADEGGEGAAEAAQELATLLEAAEGTASARAAFVRATDLLATRDPDPPTSRVTWLLEHARFESRARQWAASLELLDRAQAELDALGPNVDASTRNRIGHQVRHAAAVALRRLGRPADALVRLGADAAGGDVVGMSPEDRDLRGALLVETGRLEEALELYAAASLPGAGPAGEAPEAGEARSAPDPRIEVGRAEALVDLARYEEALSPLEAVVARIDAGEAAADAELRARVAFALAQALRGTGGDEERVRRLATAAREAWAADTDQLSQDRLSRIEAFLAE